MTDININYLAEAINDKADRDLENITANVSFVVETWRDGANWYRLYNDGWCEQGGSSTGNGNSGITVSLLKTYSDAK